jgi:hypothetical protein
MPAWPRLAAAKFEQATLWVLDSNIRARRFYEAGGWVADGARKVDESHGFPIAEVRYQRALPLSAAHPFYPSYAARLVLVG